MFQTVLGLKLLFFSLYRFRKRLGTPILQRILAFVGSLARGSYSQFYCHLVYAEKKRLTKTQGLLGGVPKPPPLPTHPPRTPLPPLKSFQERMHEHQNKKDVMRGFIAHDAES